MTRKGPPPKPTAAKRRAGNPGLRGLNDQEPEVDAALLEAPDHLGGYGRDEWKRVAMTLCAKGFTSLLDRAALVGYCDCWDTYVRACRKIEDEGEVLIGEKGGQYIHPWHNIKTASLKQMNAFAGELGMTPASRSRIHTIGTGDKAGGKRGMVKVG